VGCSSRRPFLALAGQAGLMRRLALGVLERSLRDLQAWRAAGEELSMAVNLSVSNLQDVALPEQVASCWRPPASRPTR
jgi:EAL domain-containing protein (putative c-di-GMP-specific phosphodiesterase class I)